MAQTGYTPIQLYRTTTSGAAPDAANLNPGELAININDADMALYAENQSGTVKRLMNNPAGLKYPTADGTPNQILKTDGAGNLTFVTPASPGTGTVTSVGGTGTVNGITLTGTVTSSGNLTLGGALSGVSLTTQVSGTLPVLNGGTGTTTPALVAGTNVTISGTWPNQTINATSSGGTVTSVAALTLGTSGTDVSSTVANGTTTPVITLNIPTASASNRGALSSTDWSAFNGKLSTTGGTMTGAITFAAGQTFTGTVSTGKSIAMAMIFGF